MDLNYLATEVNKIMEPWYEAKFPGSDQTNLDELCQNLQIRVGDLKVFAHRPDTEKHVEQETWVRLLMWVLHAGIQRGFAPQKALLEYIKLCKEANES